MYFYLGTVGWDALIPSLRDINHPPHAKKASVGNSLDRSETLSRIPLTKFTASAHPRDDAASSPTNVCRFAANIYVSRRGRVPPPYRASCPSPTKPNTPVLIPAVTQPKQRRGYFLMPEGKQQRQQGQQAKQVDATNQQGSFQRTQDRPQALLTGQLGVCLLYTSPSPRD